MSLANESSGYCIHYVRKKGSMPFYPVEKKINKWPDSLVTIKSVNSFFKIRFMPAAGHKVIDYQSYRFSLHDYAIFIFFVLHLYFFAGT